MWLLTEHFSRSHHTIESTKDISESRMASTLDPFEDICGIKHRAQCRLVVCSCTQTDYTQVLEAYTELPPLEANLSRSEVQDKLNSIPP